MKFTKLKAGALQFTMFIIVVIALLLAAFIMIVHFHNRFKKDTTLLIDTFQLSNTSINNILNDRTIFNELENNKGTNPLEHIETSLDYWGIYETIKVSTKIKSKVIHKMALVGSKQTEAQNTALVLKDNNKPLVLVGNTTIQGDVMLPNRGVRAGNISGVSYYGEQLIQGDIETISGFPELSEQIKNNLDQIETKLSDIAPNQYQDISQIKSLKNSFYEPLKVVYEQGTINLMDVTLTGHIIVYSETKIVVNASANITDIVLVAPTIEIRSNVKGRFQALASKHISVGNDCELSYPSALVLQPTNKINTKSTDGAMINISESSNIAGSVVYLGQEEEGNYKPQIFIDKNSLITGEVYCTNNMDLRGTIYGAVYTHDFIAAQSGSIYQNHIYNGIINAAKRPVQFSGVMFNETKKRSVLKWLY